MKDIYLKKANEIADCIDTARATNGYYYSKSMDILELGNRWTVYWSKLCELMQNYYNLGMGYSDKCADRATFISALVRILADNDVEFHEHTSAAVYLHDFECEHLGDMEGEKERIQEAGATVRKFKWVECEDTGYIFFSVPLANVDAFEKEFGRLWTFRKVS